MIRIIIVGYMAAGKTTLGRQLAKEMSLSFYDLDVYIENRMHKTISQLFIERGEQGFREIEQKMLHEVAEFEDVVISCGGGTPCFFDNMEYINQQGESIYLKASPRTIIEHMGLNTKNRPLMQGKAEEESLAFVEQHLAEREPHYAKAQKTLNIDLLNSYEKIKTAVEQLKILIHS